MSGSGHVSMVFVDPAAWGQQVGRSLMAALRSSSRGQAWSLLSLWTRLSNERARWLYARVGSADTGARAVLTGGEPIMRLKWLRGNKQSLESTVCGRVGTSVADESVTPSVLDPGHGVASLAGILFG